MATRATTTYVKNLPWPSKCRLTDSSMYSSSQDTDSLSDDVKAFVTQTLRQVSPGRIDYIQEQYRKGTNETAKRHVSGITWASLKGNIVRRHLARSSRIAQNYPMT
jgi:hypothetical protein